MLRVLERENFLGLWEDEDEDEDERSLDEEKLWTGDGRVGGCGIAMACWFLVGKTGRAVVASGRASRARRRRMLKSFMMLDGWRNRNCEDHISLLW